MTILWLRTLMLSGLRTTTLTITCFCLRDDAEGCFVYPEAWRLRRRRVDALLFKPRCRASVHRLPGSDRWLLYCNIPKRPQPGFSFAELHLVDHYSARNGCVSDHQPHILSQ